MVLLYCSPFLLRCLVEPFAMVFSVHLSHGAWSSGGGWRLGRTKNKKGASVSVKQQGQSCHRGDWASALSPAFWGQNLKRL